jgi:hypothetical protein
MPVPVSRNQARQVARVCRARVREINVQLERTSSRIPRDELLQERGKLLELIRLFEAHGDLPPSAEQFGELAPFDLNLIARACRLMIQAEREEAERLEQRMPGSRSRCSVDSYERLAAYFQRKADGA